MSGTLRRLRAEVLGINRRNHDYLFAWNARARYALVDDKRATKHVLAAHDVPAPALLDACDTQWEVRALAARLTRHADFVLKPARGAGGAGIVVVVERRADGFVKASGALATRAGLEAHACDVVAGTFSPRGSADALLVEERVVADPVLGALAWRGVPDVRVLVFRGVPVLAMLRLPTRRSDGRANLHLGGVGAGIDLPTGRTIGGVGGGGRPATTHPDLHAPLAGTSVPRWRDLLVLAVRAADAVQLGFVGVDLVVDARRGPLVLELNARPGLTIQVANRRGLRPLLEMLAGAPVPTGVDARVDLGITVASAGAAA